MNWKNIVKFYLNCRNGGIMDKIEYGYCYCGCGERTKIALYNCVEQGHIKGEPLRFIHNHHSRLMTGKKHHMYGRKGKDCPNWKGGIKIAKHKNTSYVMVYMPEHLKSDINGYVYEHRLIVEKEFNCEIPDRSVIHHVDGNGLNNDLTNLMVFKSNAEHISFHWKELSL